MMTWISASILIGACVFSAMAGLTLGVNMNPASVVSYIWDWNAAGSWASGLGALLAVVFALHQSHKQQEKERARCQITIEDGEWFFKVQVVSQGIIPATLLSASIKFDNGLRVYDLSDFPKLGVSFPLKLERGDVSTLVNVRRDEYRRLAFSVVELLIADLRRLDIAPTPYSRESAEEYFLKLRECGNRDSVLQLKTAHADLQQPLSATLIRNFISIVESEHREKLDRERKSLAKDLESWTAAAGQDGGDQNHGSPQS